MYLVAVCEDQKDTREETAALCGDILTELGVEHQVAAFSSAEALAARLLGGEQFDLLCLDILMDGGSGIELAKSCARQTTAPASSFSRAARNF